MRKFKRYFGSTLDNTPYSNEENKEKFSLSFGYWHGEEKKWLIEKLDTDYTPDFHHDLCKAVWDSLTFNLPYMFPEPLFYNIAYYRRSIYFYIHQRKIIRRTIEETLG